jgi:peptidyl-dipeptidase A
MNFNFHVNKSFRALLEPGFSKPWPDALAALTGSRVMNATSLLAYFEPLMQWLKEANKDDCIGWNCEPFAANYMENDYEVTTSNLYNQATIAEWNYETNLTEANAENSV